MNKFDLFTPEAQQAARLAADIIQRYGHNLIDTEHIFLALIEQPNSIVYKILVAVNVNVKLLYDQVDKELKNRPIDGMSIGKRGQVFITPRVKRIIDLAHKEAKQLNDAAVSSEHIFLGILLENNTPTARFLKNYDVTHEKAYKTIQGIRQLKIPLTTLDFLQSKQPSDDIQSIQVFLCHSSEDKSKVRELYHRLSNDGVNPWLDEEDLLPGFDWQLEIPKAVRNSDVVIVCLSNKSVTKAGYVQKEIKQALDIADEQPEGTIFIIPVKLEECDIPTRLKRWQWVNLFDDNGYERLMRSLRVRAQGKYLA